MDVIEAVKQRRSIRAFKADPVPRDLLRQILETALRAPSWSNSQPWELFIATGEPLAKIRHKFVEKADEDSNPDINRPYYYPEPYNSRFIALSTKQNEIKGITKEDRERRGWWRIKGLQHFGAPAEIYICIERSFYSQTGGTNVWPIFDCGLISENIMLLATEYGLGTIMQAQAVIYPDVIREVLDIPQSKIILLGMAIGYPDWNDVINQFSSDKVKLDHVAVWFGFGQG